ncbi:hypothetical protein IFM89_004625 [Coptis chinensis]|uniref:Exostosin GT47 domain-containing protein n=1 Tax=Coptis chinensis TaxID=261450 RepID=A0A835H1M0_9MAGN|nr:hypothetical protein IFM89_004625 [Coptis chinensis]
MLQTFKIFIYPTQQNQTSYSTTMEENFHSSLLESPYITTNPKEAHLFYLHVPPKSSLKSISQLIKEVQTSFPFWNQALGADHFYIACEGVRYESKRSIVELKKNSIQISCFPSTQNRYIPHKDITLPPFHFSKELKPMKEIKYLGYAGYLNDLYSKNWSSSFIKELSGDPDFELDSEPFDYDPSEGLVSSKFCLFFYDIPVSIGGISEALRIGCVAVVISDRAITDLPFMDVLKWSEIALFVGTSGGVKEVKKVLKGVCSDKYQKMREMGMAASKHFQWYVSPQPYDAFHTVLYQLWVRRHTIRYARSEPI